VGAEVEFAVTKDPRGGMRRATDVVVMAAPVEARQLGQVIMVKTNFGFIKCCERSEDLFFHFTAVVRVSVHVSNRAL